MKKLTLLIIISFFALTSFKSPEELIGTWKILKIINNETKKQDNFIDWMSFEQEGVIEIEENNLRVPGIWSYDENEKLITIKVGKESTKFKIIKLSEKKLIIDNIESRIYLKKNNKH